MKIDNQSLYEAYSPVIKMLLKKQNYSPKARTVLLENIISDMYYNIEDLRADDEGKIELVCTFTIWEWLHGGEPLHKNEEGENP